MNKDAQNTAPVDHQFGLVQPDSIVNLIMIPQHIQGVQSLSRSLVLATRPSLIDNSAAQACSLKRSRSAQPIKKINSDAKFSYKSRTPGSTLKIAGSTNTSPASSASDLRPFENMSPYVFIETVLVGEQPEDEHDQPAKLMQPLHADKFLVPTQEQIAAYSNDAIAAVRTSNVDALREIYNSGRTLQCCNRFGESLLHVACRRSNADVVSFLLNEADVSPCVRDDYGRTPLHDACWRGAPEHEIVELLLTKESRLAFVKDVRGHRPFEYARREHWAGWREFLDRRRDLILP